MVLSMLLILAGCKSGESASNSTAKPVLSGNSNQAGQKADSNASGSNPGAATPAVKPTEPAQLLGTYESREVHDNGVVTLITNLKTRWMFSADGTYQRVSEVKGKPYHADAGTYRIEPPDKLVLSIQVTGPKNNRHIQNPPLAKTHIFSLSPDGGELRFTSEKGSIGIFERVSKPRTP